MRKTQKRWMKSVIEASKAEQPKLPFQRGYRRPETRGPRIEMLRRSA